MNTRKPENFLVVDYFGESIELEYFDFYEIDDEEKILYVAKSEDYRNRNFEMLPFPFDSIRAIEYRGKVCELKTVESRKIPVDIMKAFSSWDTNNFYTTVMIKGQNNICSPVFETTDEVAYDDPKGSLQNLVDDVAFMCGGLEFGMALLREFDEWSEEEDENGNWAYEYDKTVELNMREWDKRIVTRLV